MSNLTKFSDFNNVENLFIDNISNIEIIAIEKISSHNKLDYVLFKHYGEECMKFLKLILSYNNIPDIIEINNKLIKIPDIFSLINNIEIVEFNTNKCNGVNSLFKDDKKIVHQKNNVTIANPKLNITLQKVRYDDNTGKLKF